MIPRRFSQRRRCWDSSARSATWAAVKHAEQPRAGSHTEMRLVAKVRLGPRPDQAASGSVGLFAPGWAGPRGRRAWACTNAAASPRVVNCWRKRLLVA